MNHLLFTGCATALATPFNDKGIDVAALERQVHWQIEEGVSALIPCGTTGEPSCMSDEEWALVVSTVVKAAAGRVPVIAGTGDNNTHKVIALAKRAKDLGAAGQLCVTPYYNKATQQGLVAHYEAIANESELPLILYNVPSRTGLNMLPDTVSRLSKHPQVAGLKEAWGDMAQLGDAMLGSEGRIAFYSGADEGIVPLMALGGLGVISVMSNILPRYTAELCRAMLEGDYKKGAQMQLKALPLIHALFSEVSPAPLKQALHWMGRYENRLRLPLVPMSEAKQPALKAAMQEMGLL